jgi:hypothetical protein
MIVVVYEFLRPISHRLIGVFAWDMEPTLDAALVCNLDANAKRCAA